MRIRLDHTTRYDYGQPAFLGPHLIRLRPAPQTPAPIANYEMRLVPANTSVHWQQDTHGNFVARCLFEGATAKLEIGVSLETDIVYSNPFDFIVEPGFENVPFGYSDEDSPDLAPYLEREPLGPNLREFLSGVPALGGGTIGFLVELNRYLREKIDYEVRLEEGTHTCEEVLGIGRGSCRDSGWLLVQVLRQLGFAARFVSGYLVEIAEHGGHDAIALHAWAETYLPGAGWVGLDPSSGLLTGAGHIPLAATRHWQQATPVSGTASVPALSFEVEMGLERL